MPRVRPRELVSVQKREDIRFLTVVSSLSRGGTERAARNYALGYRRAGYPSAILAYNGGGPRRAQLEEAGVTVFEGGPDGDGTRSAVAEAGAWNPDVVHLNRPGEADEHSAGVLRALIHPRMRVFETNVFAYADRSADRVTIDLHLHLSRWCLWKWTQSIKGLAPNSPGIVVPYSVDCGAFSAVAPGERSSIRRDFGIPQDAIVFGRVGQPSISKWSPIPIRAFEAVARELPNAWMAVCGLPDQLRSMVSHLPAEARSRVVELPITNSDAELRRYYGLMDVFVHASEKGESFGMVLCEAMLSGLPVITLNTPLRDNSQIEVVRHRKEGIVVENPQQTIEAMLTCVRDQGKYESMKQAAPLWVWESFDIPVVTRRLLTIAPISLAATSSEELKHRLAEIPGMAFTATPGYFRTLLASAGIAPSFKQDMLISLVNRPIGRRAIGFARSTQALARRIAKHR
jgi:glycosyltransferase involved in cell wall biosynthesis